MDYWTEDRKTGRSEGQTEITSVQVVTNTDFSAKVDINISYHPPGEKEILAEKRSLSITTPDKNGCYRIDWTSTFTAKDEDVKLDRTPIVGEPHGQGYGGYAGLSVRMAVCARKWKFMDRTGIVKGDMRKDKDAVWLATVGKTPEGKDAGIAVLDHPSNMRHPTPWYITPSMPYFSPAVLYEKPHVLEKGKSFTLKYRVLVSSQEMDKDMLEKEWLDFSSR
ncbi:MAG: PmoA family protein [Phycisphaerae bacterium]|nr:PmoA family protein [Phycisphaerae bacterium]